MAYLLVVIFSASVYSQSLLEIRITEGVDNAIPIAILPVVWEGQSRFAPQPVDTIVSSDLRRSGKFSPLSRAKFPKMDFFNDKAFFEYPWRSLNVDWLVRSRLQELADGKIVLSYEVYNVGLMQRVAVFDESMALRKSFRFPAKDTRYVTHRMSDSIFEAVTGIPGAFTTKITYVTIDYQREYPFQLYVADVDGFNSRLMFKSKEPLMSPSWSPQGDIVAYVSFERGRPSIVLHNLQTQEREFVTSYPGINGAPSWSPNGQNLAMVLSKDGNPEIYVLDLITRQTTRLTRNRAIDTEPSWAPDGESLIFTSDRGGRPQIYRINKDGTNVERLTFTGNYNAGASYFPDGKRLVLVHRADQVFHIATLDLDSGATQVLTKTHLDESPSLAPNGSMILYATVSGRRQILAAVSTDGRFNFTLPARKGEVRAPAWSPFFN
ncbi:MAG: Tol-Pal system beta propeller repeat protein TolB [Pseudomonadota bacterium]